jgi:hypothetical protein
MTAANPASEAGPRPYTRFLSTKQCNQDSSRKPGARVRHGCGGKDDKSYEAAGAFENRNEVGFLALALRDDGFYTGGDFIELANRLNIASGPYSHS